MYLLSNMSLDLFSRSPHGERGLKLDFDSDNVFAVGRSPHGERGLKSEWNERPIREEYRRSPHGERGLKCSAGGPACSPPQVAPRTGSVG